MKDLKHMKGNYVEQHMIRQHGPELIRFLKVDIDTYYIEYINPNSDICYSGTRIISDLDKPLDLTGLYWAPY